MTDGHGEAPLSRREARERERLSRQGSRRASTAGPTLAGESPDVETFREQEEVFAPARESAAVPDSATVPDQKTPPLAARSAPVGPFTRDQPVAGVPEHTMTRRQLRELREAEEAAALALLEAGAAMRDAEHPAETQAVGASASTRADSDGPDSQEKKTAEAVTPSKAFKPPVGHWSIAAQQDDDAPDFDQIIAPTDTAGHGSSGSALILPSMPPRGDSLRPVGKSGEMLTTGSIELPHSLGTTGQHPRFDSAELDRMFEQDEQRLEASNVHTSSVEPVRASSAVSTHTSTRDVVTTTKANDNRLPIVLAVSAGVMAVGVVGLFVAGAIWGIF